MVIDMNYWRKVINARHNYLRDVAKKLEELEYYINVEELDKIEAVTSLGVNIPSETIV